MTWQVRHEGSPHSVTLSLDELRQGLIDGQWEPTDEVLGPGETEWVALESHPQLEELAESLEPPPIKHYGEETHIDMTALIDVCLVLLVFFILTTTVAALQHRIQAPSVEEKGKTVGVLKVTKEQVQETMIHVTAKMEGGSPVVLVEGKPVDLDNLASELRRIKGASKKTRLLLEHDDKVAHEFVVRIIDAATTARLEDVNLLLP